MYKRMFALQIADALCSLEAFRLYRSGDNDKLINDLADFVPFCNEHSNLSFDEVRNKIVNQLLNIEEQIKLSFSHSDFEILQH